MFVASCEGINVDTEYVPINDNDMVMILDTDDCVVESYKFSVWQRLAEASGIGRVAGVINRFSNVFIHAIVMERFKFLLDNKLFIENRDGVRTLNIVGSQSQVYFIAKGNNLALRHNKLDKYFGYVCEINFSTSFSLEDVSFIWAERLNNSAYRVTINIRGRDAYGKVCVNLYVIFFDDFSFAIEGMKESVDTEVVLKIYEDYRLSDAMQARLTLLGRK